MDDLLEALRARLDQTTPQQEAARISRVYYIADALPGLRAMTDAKRLALLHECNQLNLTRPLHYEKGRFYLEHWPTSEGVTGIQITALLVAGLFVMVNEDQGMAAMLIKSFPEIIDALILAPRKDSDGQDRRQSDETGPATAPAARAGHKRPRQRRVKARHRTPKGSDQ